jgi:hypothetical protein
MSASPSSYSAHKALSLVTRSSPEAPPPGRIQPLVALVLTQRRTIELQSSATARSNPPPSRAPSPMAVLAARILSGSQGQCRARGSERGMMTPTQSPHQRWTSGGAGPVPVWCWAPTSDPGLKLAPPAPPSSSPVELLPPPPITS